MPTRTILGASLLLLALVSPRARAQQDSLPPYRMRLLGVYDEQSGDPVEGVTVADVMGQTSTVTGPSGTISLFFLPEGTSVIRLQKLGYEPQTLTVTIAPTETSPLTMLMHHIVQLPTVVTKDASTTHMSSGLQGFMDRAHKKQTGYFITDSTLRKNDNENLADVLRSNAPGVRLNVTQGAMYLIQTPRCHDGTSAGPPQVYLDGTPLVADFPPAGAGGHLPVARSGAADNRQQPFDLSQFHVSDLAGVEWYPDADMIPIEFDHTAARCGALFLWTRQQ